MENDNEQASSSYDLAGIPREWLEEFEAAARRPMETRIRYAFVHTYKPVLDDAPYRSFDTTAEYRKWCEENLPEWLGYGPMKAPLDTTPYSQDPRSMPIAPGISDGVYVYVQDVSQIVYVLPDGPHLHPKVLGGCKSAEYAGDLTVIDGKVVDLTNLAGTFQFASKKGLKAVARQIRGQGVEVEVGAVRFFPSDGSRPVILE